MAGTDDDAPQLAWWIPEKAVKDLEMEKVLHGNESHIEMAKRLLRENLPMAVMSVNHLSLYSPREEIRLAASKYIIEHAMGTPGKSDLPTGKHAWENIHDAVLVQSAKINKGRE